MEQRDSEVSVIGCQRCQLSRGEHTGCFLDEGWQRWQPSLRDQTIGPFYRIAIYTTRLIGHPQAFARPSSVPLPLPFAHTESLTLSTVPERPCLPGGGSLV